MISLTLLAEFGNQRSNSISGCCRLEYGLRVRVDQPLNEVLSTYKIPEAEFAQAEAENCGEAVKH